MIRFGEGDRVLVKETVEGIVLNALGNVTRVCNNGALWVELDERSKVSGVHPFPARDERARKVKTHPDLCERPTTTGKERRKARRANDRDISIDDFGVDHWSTFAYLETRAVDHQGGVDITHMRCDPRRHPTLAHRGSAIPCSPSRLKDGTLLHDHDDWDCVDDFERCGLLQNVGTALHPRIQFTPIGLQLAARLRAHKAHGGSYSTFSP